MKHKFTALITILHVASFFISHETMSLFHVLGGWRAMVPAAPSQTPLSLALGSSHTGLLSVLSTHKLRPPLMPPSKLLLCRKALPWDPHFAGSSSHRTEVKSLLPEDTT